MSTDNCRPLNELDARSLALKTRHENNTEILTDGLKYMPMHAKPEHDLVE